MKQIDFNKLEQDLVNNNKEEASSTITSFFESDLTSEERGEILVNFALVYARVKTRLNQNYLESLKATLADLKLINELEQKGNNDLEIDNIRNKIRDL